MALFLYTKETSHVTGTNSKWWCHFLYMRQNPYWRPANVNSCQELCIGCVISKSIQAHSYQSSCFHVVKAVLAFFFSRHTKQRIVHQDKHPVTGTCTRAFSQSLCIISKCIIGTVTFWWCELAGLAFKQTSDGVILFVVTAEAVLSYSLSAKDRRVRHTVWSLIIFYIINLIWINIYLNLLAVFLF